MKQFSRTLIEFLTGRLKRVAKASETREYRIFLASFPPAIIHDVGRAVEDYLLGIDRDVEFVFRIGHHLWMKWQNAANSGSEPVLRELSSLGWVDTENRLTYFRNMKWSPSSGKDALVVVLAGVDRATDSASLADFYQIDSRTVWTEALGSRFHPWLKQKLEADQIPASTSDLKKMDELLQILHRHFAGDLLRISEILDQVSFSDAITGEDALRTLYGNLDFWGLPPLKSMMTAKWADYVRDTIDFFRYKPFLKESDRKKALKKIGTFLDDNSPADQEKLLSLSAEFDDADDFCACLTDYIQTNSAAARNRLLKTDFGPVQDAIFKVKKPNGSEKKKTQKVTPISGPPVEAVLTALWDTVAEFKKDCTKKDIRPAEVLRSIRVVGRGIVERPTEGASEESDGPEVIAKSIGGIDAFLNDKFMSMGFGASAGGSGISVTFDLLNSDMSSKTNRTATPHLEFEVKIEPDGEPGLTRRFKWWMEDTHPLRNLWFLAGVVASKLNQVRGTWLPVFHIPHYAELFTAPDADEMIRILNIGLGRLEVVNLLGRDDLAGHPGLSSRMAVLSDAFGAFVKGVAGSGYFAAMASEWPGLKAAYADLLTHLIENWEEGPGSPAYKAFLLTEAPESSAVNYGWLPYVSSAVITGLHPALLEMLHERDAFLVEAWQHRVRSFLEDDTGRKMTPRGWRDIRDLATVSNPLFGILTNSEKRLDARVESFGMIHRIGTPPASGATLMTKVLQRYDAPEDDGIDGKALFRESRESRVIHQLLKQYCRIYPHCQDGISIAVLNANRIQPVIAGVDEFLKRRFTVARKGEIEGYPPFHLSLSCFVNLSESREVSRWLREWQAYWDPATGATQYKYYQHCRPALFQKVVADPREYLGLIGSSDFEADIAVLLSFLDVSGGGSDLVNAPPCPGPPVGKALRRFPVVETPRCVDQQAAKRLVRGRIISNRHFELATLHSELTARLKHPDVPSDRRHLVVCEGSYEPWVEIVNRLHERATWVLCLDPAVDERLIAHDYRNSSDRNKRSIIGFASGVGIHGELNFTVSTERASLGDIHRKMADKVNEIFGPWEPGRRNAAARLIVTQARALSGLSLVQATGKGEQVRNLIGYGVVRRCLPPPAKPAGDLLLRDELVVLDTYYHWFDNVEDGSDMYPDLLRIVAFVDAGDRVRVEATLFECKVSSDVLRYLETAWSQLENGLHHLMARFRPWHPDAEMRFDQRFWWSQLQRLIANKAVVSGGDQARATAALEKLGNGDFSIAWRAAALTVRTDGGDDKEFSVDQQWSFPLPFAEGTDGPSEMAIPVISCGGPMIARLAEGDRPCLPLDPDAWCRVVPGDPGGGPETPGDEPTPPDGTASETVPLFEKTGTDDPPKPIDPKPETGDGKTDPPPDVRPPADRIFLGRSDKGGEIFWEYGHPELTNRHLLIFGKSGVGKTYAIQALLLEMARAGQNALIIDYTDGFLAEHIEAPFKARTRPSSHLVIQKPLPINPFRRQRSVLDDGSVYEEKPFIVGGRITSVMTSVYSSFGDQQQGLLTKTISEGLERDGENFDFRMLLSALDAAGKPGVTLANKLNPLVEMELFAPRAETAWDGFFNGGDGRVSILQLTRLPKHLQRIATELILWDLYDYATSSGRKDNPLPIVLDEIQNLDHRLDAPLGKYLTEGRKFGISLILATQTLSNLKTDERDRLFQASHKLFFRPAETEVREYARILEQSSPESADIWISRLNRLNKGECYSLGPAVRSGTGSLENRAFKIRIAAFEERE